MSVVPAPLEVSSSVPRVDVSELSQRLQAEVSRLTAEVERLNHEAMTKQPISKQLQLELDLERGKRKDMAQVIIEIDGKLTRVMIRSSNFSQD